MLYDFILLGVLVCLSVQSTAVTGRQYFPKLPTQLTLRELRRPDVSSRCVRPP